MWARHVQGDATARLQTQPLARKRTSLDDRPPLYLIPLFYCRYSFHSAPPSRRQSGPPTGPCRSGRSVHRGRSADALLLAGMAPSRNGRCLLLLALVQTCAAFSTFAGSCKHAGVQHGLDRFAAQECVLRRTPRRCAPC